MKVGYSVPFGLRGTVIGIHQGDKQSDISCDVVFDEEFAGGFPLRSVDIRINLEDTNVLSK